jgi:hypothetical protein
MLRPLLFRLKLLIIDKLFQQKMLIVGNLKFYSHLREFRNQSLSSSFKVNFPYDRNHKMLTDFYEQAGVASGHYFHQDIYVAREIYRRNPVHHHDIGSRIDGFISSLAVFREVEVFDIRELESSDPNIHFRKLDILNTAAVRDMEQVLSLSCLHTAEHFGLGRYGDPINFDGWFIGLKNMTSLVASGGIFYFSTPISSRQRIVFNAHRIFDPHFLTTHFLKDFEVLNTAAIRDTGEMDLSVDFQSAAFLSDFNDDYACGIWTLQKK